MLGWLAAAAAPILIHLWMRQTHRETAWAAIRFLQAALERQARRLRLQHWLLLAVRTLLLVFVALAAAKPLLDSGLLGGGAPAHRVLIVDASLSMSGIDGQGETALDRAKQTALEIADGTRAGDAISLVVMGADAGVPLGRPISDAAAAGRAIEAITPSQGVADLSQAMATAMQLIEADKKAGLNRRQEVVFLSDLGINTWDSLTSDSQSRSAMESLTRLEELAEVSVFDFGDTAVPNAAITSLALADGLPTLAAPVEVRGEARLDGGKPAERIVELVIDGTVVEERSVRLIPGRPTPIDFVRRFERGGPRSISLRIASTTEGADRLRADDERFAAVTLRRRVRVLCVAGSPGAADYLADALDPTGEGAFEPVVVSDADLPTIDLEEYVCVFLSNVRELSTKEAERLGAYVGRGGGVALLLGDRVNAARYNELLAPPRGELGAARQVTGPLHRVSVDAEPVATEGAFKPGQGSLMPGWLSASVSAPSYRVDPLDYAHPIAQPFRGQERAGLLNTPVMRHFPITLPEAGGGASIALTLENGDPLLVTGQVGRGRVAVLTTAATLASVDPATGQAWTALPAWPSFLPIVRGMVRYLARDEAGGGSRFVGDPIEGRTPPDSLADVTIDPPEGVDPSRLAPDSDGAWRFAATKRAGVYRYGLTDEAPTGAVAINIDPAESDSVTVATDRLPSALKVRRGLNGTDAASETTAAPTPIHRWLLYGALALALIEPAMACLFGRSGR